MLALDPADRPASAAEVERQLRAWSSGVEDQADDEAFDETTILSRMPDTSESTQVSLPELDAVADGASEATRLEPPSGPVWPWLAAGVAGLVMLALAVWLAIRR
jgi:hypothetical protein